MSGGRIGSRELQRYAKLSGFDGDDEDWAEEYRELCLDHGWDEELGLNEEDFLHLMADEELMGPLEELRAVLMELRMPLKRRHTQMSLAGKTAGASRVRGEVKDMPRALAPRPI